mgnify:CR=1 FL=1
MTNTISEIIQNIKTVRRELNIPKSRLAEIAGVWENSTRNIDDDDWNPTIETALKLEAAIHKITQEPAITNKN